MWLELLQLLQFFIGEVSVTKNGLERVRIRYIRRGHRLLTTRRIAGHRGVREMVRNYLRQNENIFFVKHDALQSMHNIKKFVTAPPWRFVPHRQWDTTECSQLCFAYRPWPHFHVSFLLHHFPLFTTFIYYLEKIILPIHFLREGKNRMQECHGRHYRPVPVHCGKQSNRTGLIFKRHKAV